MSTITALYRKIQFNIRSHKKVKLSRSTGGTIGIFLFLLIVCSFMALPLVYAR